MGIKYIYKRLKAEWAANMWLAVELLVVSVVIWFTVDQLFVQTKRVNEDKGFDITDTYLITIESLQPEAADYDETAATDSAVIRDRQDMVERLRRRPEVEAVGLSSNSYPYNPNNSWTTVRHLTESGDTLDTDLQARYVSPDFIRIFRYRGANGETPEQLATIIEREPNAVMLSSNILGKNFDACSLTGKEVYIYGGGSESDPVKVSGIFHPVKYTEYGSLSRSRSMIFALGVDDNGNPAWGNEVTLKVRDGMGKDFIENLMADSESQFRVGNFYISNVQSLDDIARLYTLETSQKTRNKLIVMLFLLFNVFLGLFGTFWFRTQQRCPEIALMKAIGASSRSVFFTQIGEGLLLLLSVTPIAALIDINMAVMELNAYGDTGYLEWPRMIACILIVFAIMAVMIVCGVSVPARRAMRVNPAEALHDE